MPGDQSGNLAIQFAQQNYEGQNFDLESSNVGKTLGKFCGETVPQGIFLQPLDGQAGSRPLGVGGRHGEGPPTSLLSRALHTPVYDGLQLAR